MTNNPYERRQNNSAHDYKYYCYSEAYTKRNKSYISNIFIMENSTGKLFF